MTTGKIIGIGAAIALVIVLLVWGTPPKHPSAGNVLLVASESKPDSLDPAMSYQAIAWQMMINTGNGLLTYKKASGVTGSTLVPDLATSMPQLLDGGRTYVFTMRKGVKYGPPSNREVMPSDIQFAIERGLNMASPGGGFFANLVGEEDFLAKKAPHISGIIVNDATRTITFKLTRPDTTFQYILAMPFTFAVPKGTPLKDMTSNGFVPATGPYMFVSYKNQRTIVMKRNPNFRQWSPDVPPGNVDGMTIKIGVSGENAVTLVKRGQLDFMMSAVPRSKLPSLLADNEWKQHLYIDPAASTSYIFMNYRYPPFNNLKMRQAINWAIDRRAMVKLSGGVGVPTETVLPPDMPGYTPHNFYPKQDIATAQKLVKESGVKPGKIDIWCRTTEPGPTFAVYLQDVLTQLGFTPTVKCVDSSAYFELVGNEKTKALIGFGNWGQDFPEGSDFIDVLLNGARITGEHNNNLSWYTGADKQIAEANNLLAQPARNAAWGKLDAQIVQDAAWAPFMHGTLYSFTSKRLCNYTYSPVYGLLYMQVKVKGKCDAAPAGDAASASGGGGAPAATAAPAAKVAPAKVAPAPAPAKQVAAPAAAPTPLPPASSTPHSPFGGAQ